MNTVSRTISGIVIFAMGLFIVAATLIDSSDTFTLVLGLAWGVFIAGVGIYLFFNKKEDDIEEIKNTKK